MCMYSYTQHPKLCWNKWMASRCCTVHERSFPNRAFQNYYFNYQFHFKQFIDIIIIFWDPPPEGEERHYLHIDASAMSVLLYSNNTSKLRKQASYGVYKFRKTKEPFFRPGKFGKKWHFWPRPYFGNFVTVSKIICRSRIWRRKNGKPMPTQRKII